MTDFSQSQKQYMEVLFNKISSSVKQDILEVTKDLKTQINKIEQDIKGVVQIHEDKITKLEKGNHEIKKNIKTLEKQNRKNNIVIFGIENSKETLWNEVIHVFTDILEIEINASDINDVFTLGSSKNSPVKIEFISFQKKLVLNNAKKLRGKGIYINHDLCEEDRNNNKVLIKHMKQAKNKGLQSYIKGNKLIIGKDSYTAEQLESGSAEKTNDIEENKETSGSAPATPNPQKRETRLRKEFGIAGEQEGEEEEYKTKTSKTIKTDKAVIKKTRSNSTASTSEKYK